MPPTKVSKVVRGVPDFVQKIKDDYQAQIAHVFILNGNIYDFVDNGGNDLGIKKVLAANFDDNIGRGLNPNAKVDNNETGVQPEDKRNSPKTRIMAFYNTSTGLEFPDPRSKDLWIEAFRQVVGGEELDEMGPGYFQPNSPEAALALINRWFSISVQINKANKIRKVQMQAQIMELVLTLIFTDAETLFPAGDISNLCGDRAAIVHVRNWAQDSMIGDRNRIILMTRHAMDIHDSIRGELAVTHLVRKPNLQDRLEWITNFDKNIRAKVTVEGPQTVGTSKVSSINMVADFDLPEFALQSAGMNRRQIKDVILNSWRNDTPIDFPMVQERKKRALDDEYGGMIDIKEGKFGFEQIGGHEHFKDYATWEVIKPLRGGNKKLCSRGCLMLGPPGTGKTMEALALAKEANLNFLDVDLGSVFGGTVGESEKNVRKLIEAIEAAAPCIVFIDEPDSVLSSGRVSSGDSGTAGRVFNRLMVWLSEPSRVGKVVVFMATNRPDLLDGALIRAGRIDAKIPMLPPVKGDAKGRYDILGALTRKHKLVLSPELVATANSNNNGLGLLLKDTSRFWTGAEIEQVLQSAFRRAARAERMQADKPDLRITIEDWNQACRHNSPTGDVETQIDLALEYAGLDYVPEEWLERALEVKAKAADRDRIRSQAA